MEKFIAKIICAILTGRDYRTYVLATINERLFNEVHRMLVEIFGAKKEAKGSDWWMTSFLNEHQDKRRLLWYGGLNEKTVFNMAGTTRKSLCIDISRQNIESIRILLDELVTDEFPRLEMKLKYKGDEVVLNETESLVLLNSVAAVRLTLQGGAWSEVGKKSEKRLLFTIFRLLEMEDHQYLLVPEKIKKHEIVGNREIDGLVFCDDGQTTLRIELKLLGIGNPEIGDEAIARGVELFLTDRLTDMMIKEAENKGVTVIELRDPEALVKIYDFFTANDVSCSKPAIEEDFDAQVERINRQYDEETEDIRVLRKLREITT